MENFGLKFGLLIVLKILQVNCQDFSPTLNTKCFNGLITITVRTLTPFFGILYAEKDRKNCQAVGTGLFETKLQLSLTDFDKCGIVYEEADEQYFVLVHVREHPMIILQQDRTFNISCNHAGHSSGEESQKAAIKMGVYSELGKVHRTLFGDTYRVKIESQSGQDFIVSQCVGFAGTNNSLELTDNKGCSRNLDLMSNFVYNYETRSASAQLHSMFKFPNQHTIHMQCAIIICDEQCLGVDCERRRDDPIDRNPRQQALTQMQYTSTTVQVDDVGNRTEIVHVTQCSYYYTLMSSLCIVFGCLFLASLCVNCFFCSMSGYCPFDSLDDAPVTPPVSSRNIDAYSNAVLHYPAITWPDTLATDGASISSQVKNVRSLNSAQPTPRNSAQPSPTSSGTSSDRPLINRTPTPKAPPLPPQRMDKSHAPPLPPQRTVRIQPTNLSVHKL